LTLKGRAGSIPASGTKNNSKKDLEV